jgi:integrase
VFGDGTNYLPRPKPDGGRFAGAVKRAKLQKITTQHGLRHICASVAINSGVNELSRMLGHTSANVTLDIYADLFDTDLDAVASTGDPD